MTTESAKTVVERAAHFELAPETIPDDAREQSLRAFNSNATTAVKDKQFVALFVMNDAGVADEVPEIVRSSAPAARAQADISESITFPSATGWWHRGARKRLRSRPPTPQPPKVLK